MKNIGIRIRQFRTENNLQQKELAVAVWITQSKLSKIESNGAKPDIELLTKISRYLNTPLEKFYTDEKEINSQNTGNIVSTKSDMDSLITKIEQLKKELMRKDDLIAEDKSTIAQLNKKVFDQDVKIKKLKKEIGKLSNSYSNGVNKKQAR